MSNDIDELREAWENLPEGEEDWISLYHNGIRVAYVYKSKRDFDEVFLLFGKGPYVWRPIAEVAIVFDRWIVEELWGKAKS